RGPGPGHAGQSEPRGRTGPHAHRHAPAHPRPAVVPARGLVAQPRRTRNRARRGGPMNWRRIRNPAFIAALLVLTGAAIGLQAAIDRYRIYLRKLPIYAQRGRAVRAIPAETEHWIRVGQDWVEGEETLDVLGTENYVTRVYAENVTNRPPRRIQLHVAYYTGMI